VPVSGPGQQVDIPPLAAFQAIAADDPIGCAAALAPHAGRLGYRFPRPHAQLRRECIRAASAMTDPDTGRRYTQTKLATLVGGLHPTRVGQILRRCGARDLRPALAKATVTTEGASA
jgi:hypothetical protein